LDIKSVVLDITREDLVLQVANEKAQRVVRGKGVWEVVLDV
jgi:hypothetical protein